jgi:hypothetical protein
VFTSAGGVLQAFAQPGLLRTNEPNRDRWYSSGRAAD